MSREHQPPQLRPQSGRVDRAEIIKGSGSFAPMVPGQELRNPEITDFRESNIAVSPSARPAPARVQATEIDSRQQRDSRFMLSHHTREALSVSHEEERVVEERVRQRVVELAAQAREEAAARGHEEGFEQGRQEARERFGAEGKSRLDALDALIGELDGMKAAIFRHNEGFLIDLIYRISRRVLLRELRTDREYLARLCSEMIEKMGLRENLRLKIHPSDAGSLEQLREGIGKRLGELRNLNIEASAEVREGGCLLETEQGAIDASLTTQFEEIAKALEAAAESSPSGPAGGGGE